MELQHHMLGKFTFDALSPVKEVNFPPEFFNVDDCEVINSIILEEAMTFVTFMQAIMGELLGKEESMMKTLTGISMDEEAYEKLSLLINGGRVQYDDSDEEFDD